MYVFDILEMVRPLAPGDSVYLEGSELLDYADTLYAGCNWKLFGESKPDVARIRALSAIRLTNVDFQDGEELLKHGRFLFGVMWEEIN